MSYGIITCTKNGVNLALKLQAQLPDCDIYAKAGRVPEDLDSSVELAYYDRMQDIVKVAFYSYDALIFFASTGIAVRMLAPFMQHKVKDPAVVVCDEQGNFAISLLSGHLGGANEITQEIAQIIKATPVITTATDSQKKVAPDVVARDLNLVPYPLEAIKIVNGALVNGEEVVYYIDKHWPHQEATMEILAKYKLQAKIIDIDSLTMEFGNSKEKRVVISTQRGEYPNTLILTPKRLIAGVGCRRGVSLELIDKALKAAKAMVGWEEFPISRIVSTIVKQDEENLLKWAEQHEIPINFFPNEAMAATIAKFHIEESSFVKSQIGIGNVCEASILTYNERAKIILAKTKFEKVTVSLGWE